VVPQTESKKTRSAKHDLSAQPFMNKSSDYEGYERMFKSVRARDYMRTNRDPSKNLGLARLEQRVRSIDMN